jgi:hypothetical protein
MRVCAAGAVLAASSGPGWAQENLEQGKSPAQLFASDCGICHKSAQALVKDGYPTEAFLRVHYTSSREMAATLFTYLRAIQRADAAAGPKRSKPKPSASKPGEGKAEAKPKTPEAKPAENASGAKAAEPKTPEKKAEPADKKE